jgi:hypothetical protein
MRLAVGEDPKDVFGVTDEPAPAEPTPPAPPAPAAPAAPEPTPPAPTPPAEPTPAPAEPHHEEGKLPDRFRLTDEDDRKILLLAKQLDVSVPEAVRIYEESKKKPGESTPAPAPSADPAKPPPPPPEVVSIDTQLQAIDAEITQLTAARLKAHEDIEPEKVFEISDQIAEAKARKTQLTAQRQAALDRQTRQAQQTFETQVSESANRVYEQFPELADVDGANRLAFEGHIQRASLDPEKAKVFQHPDWPERLVKDFAAKTGLKAKGKNSSPASPAAPAPAPAPTLPPPPNARPPEPKPVVQQVPGAKLVTGPAGNPPAEPRAKPTTADLVAGVRGMTEKQREALIAQADI